VILHATTAVAFLSALGAIFFYAPVEANQGIVQKIFYIHVASAFTMYIGFFIGFLCALLYLLEKKLLWDELAVTAIEVGFVFCTGVLLTGPIWARPIWGAWWDWEPRLTTTLLLWLLYASYLVLRGYFGISPRGRTTTSIVAVLAFLDVPLIHFSVRLWRGIHPSVMGSGRGGGMPFSMQLTLAISFLATALLFFLLLTIRFRLEISANRLVALRLKRSEES